MGENTIADKYVLRDEGRWNELFDNLPKDTKIEGISKEEVKNGILVNQATDINYYIVTIGENTNKVEKKFIEEFFMNEHIAIKS